MKIDLTESNLKQAGILSEDMFSISDISVVFDILRNKLYSNKILAICREIICNARDAHREAGIPDKPIEITIPHAEDQNFRVKDYGIGISPDRMKNIFIKYASSTKRNNNLQTGGFGLGAKTPFAYVDAFSINVNYEGVCRNYVAVIDETKIGKLCLLNEIPTKSSNGTEIIVPVRETDWRNFDDCVRQVIRYWDVSPIIKGSYYKGIGKSEPILKGKNWQILQEVSSVYTSRLVKIILDGIEYNLDTSLFSLDLSFLQRGTLLLFFNTGDLQVSVNRETLEITDKTTNAIYNAYEEFRKDYEELINEEINKCETFIDAMNEYERLSKTCVLNRLEIKYQDRILSSSCRYLYVRNFFYEDGESGSKTKLSKSKYSNFSFNKETLYCLNDLHVKVLSNSKLKKILKNNFPNYRKLQVIEYSTDWNNKDVNEFFKKHNIDLLNPILLSQYYTPAKPTKTFIGKKFLFFKNRGGRFIRSSYKEYEEDKKKKVFLFIKKPCCSYNFNCSFIPGIETSCLSYIFFNKFMKLFPNISLYAFPRELELKKIKENLPEITYLYDFISSYLEEKNLSWSDLDNINSQRNQNLNNNQELMKIKNLISNKKSVMFNFIDNVEKFKKLEEKYIGLTFLTALVKPDSKNNDFNLLEDFENVEKKYPLLSFISRIDKTNIPSIVDYINLVDETSTK